MPILASEHNLCQSSSSQRSIFAEKTRTLISHNLKMCHQNLKKKSGIHIDHVLRA